MRWLGIGLLLAAGLAGAASAAPFVAVDATPNVMAMIDEGSLVRGGGTVDVDVLVVPGAGSAQLNRMRFTCTARTWQQVSQRVVAADLSLSSPKLVSAPAAGVSPGSIGAALLERACFNRQVNTTGGWTAPTLGDAIQKGRAALARAAAKP